MFTTDLHGIPSAAHFLQVVVGLHLDPHLGTRPQYLKLHRQTGIDPSPTSDNLHWLTLRDRDLLGNQVDLGVRGEVLTKLLAGVRSGGVRVDSRGRCSVDLGRDMPRLQMGVARPQSV